MNGERLTPAGHEERRRTLYVKRSEWERSKRRTWIAYLLVVAASAAGLYLAIHANDRTTRNGADAVRRSCLSRAELRLTVAGAIDELRRLAIEHASPAEQLAFLRTTQLPIDRLLSEAAGSPMHAPPQTPLPRVLIDAARGRAVLRCEAEADAFRRGSGISNAD